MTDLDTIAKAKADLAAGDSVTTVSNRYKLPLGTVKTWMRKIRQDVYISSSMDEDEPHPPAEDDKSSHPPHPPSVAQVTAEIAARRLAAAAAHAERIQRLNEQIQTAVLELLHSKIVASQKVAELLHDDVWLTKQSASGVAELAAQLDQSLLALGDRLASANAGRRDSDDGEENAVEALPEPATGTGVL